MGRRPPASRRRSMQRLHVLASRVCSQLYDALKRVGVYGSSHQLLAIFREAHFDPTSQDPLTWAEFRKLGFLLPQLALLGQGGAAEALAVDQIKMVRARGARSSSCLSPWSCCDGIALSAAWFASRACVRRPSAARARRSGRRTCTSDGMRRRIGRGSSGSSRARGASCRATLSRSGRARCRLARA